MQREGPLLEPLLRRLAECPPEFLLEPRIGNQGTVHTAALVSDLLRELGGVGLMNANLPALQPGKGAKNVARLKTIQVAVWLLHEEWFRSQGGFAETAEAFLVSGLDELAKIVAPEKLVLEPEQREELIRLALRALGLRPRGETRAQAEDRLTTLDSVERQRVIRAAEEAERRAEEVREAMRKKAAEEAAARYMRE